MDEWKELGNPVLGPSVLLPQVRMGGEGGIGGGEKGGMQGAPKPGGGGGKVRLASVLTARAHPHAPLRLTS